MYRLRYCLLTLLTCVLVAACGNQALHTPVASNCRTVSHVLGSTEVCDRPDKVVALDPHSLDLLLSLGKQPAGTMSILPSKSDVIEQPSVAIPYLGDYITTQPANIGGNSGGPSLEVLTQLNPDLIVGESRYIESASDLLAQIAPTLPLDVRSQKGKWRDNILALAQALGDETLAEAAIENYQQQVAAARADLAPVLDARPKVLVLMAASLSTGNFHAITAESFIGELLEAVGFELVYPPSSTTNAAPLSIEILPDLDAADSIFVLGYSQERAKSGETARDAGTLAQQQFASIKAEWDGNEIAQSLTASQENRVYFTTFYEWNFFNGPIGTTLVLDRLRQFLLSP
ncbi:MAG: iron-siderophore ABC transporter substrate-binding protein [Cyanobacteria bacterium P01_D01_bin.128]